MTIYRQTVLAACLLMTLAACGPKSTDAAEATEPQADAGMVVESVAGAAEASAAAHPLCELVTFADIQAAGGGNVSQLDVLNAADSDNIQCIYIDQGNYLGAGMSLHFVTSEKLAATAASRWTTAAEYFEEWTRTGTAVAGIGEGAAWVDLAGSALYALKGNTVLQISGTGLDASDASVRAKIETLAQQVIARMP